MKKFIAALAACAIALFPAIGNADSLTPYGAFVVTSLTANVTGSGTGQTISVANASACGAGGVALVGGLQPELVVVTAVPSTITLTAIVRNNHLAGDSVQCEIPTPLTSGTIIQVNSGGTTPFQFVNTNGTGVCETTATTGITGSGKLYTIVAAGQAQTGTLTIWDSTNCSGNPIYGTATGSPSLFIGQGQVIAIAYPYSTGLSWEWFTNGPQGAVYGVH